MQSVIEIIQSLARQRGRDGAPLLLLRQLDGSPGERISHLPVESDLSQAWLALTGEPFRPHQAQALMALRRGEPVALHAANPLLVQTLHLLLYATLRETRTAALVIAPDPQSVVTLHAALEQINAHLPQNLRRSLLAVAPHMRPYRGENIVITTTEALHTRLLRHHDRAWSLLWPRVRLVALADAHRHAGIAGAHLADMFVRLQRILAAHAGSDTPALLATMADVSDPQPALAALTGQVWRSIAGDDLPADATTLAVWRGPKDRLTESVWLARELQRHGFHVHICCHPFDALVLAQQLDKAEDITFGAQAVAAHVLIFAGAPGAQSDLRRMLRSGYQAVAIVLGDAMLDQMIARHSELLLSEPPTAWAEPPSNAYVSAQHILCAATELPLTEAEVAAWGVQDLVNRLVSNKQLVDLPDPEVAWKPTDAVGDPYDEFSLLASSGAAVVAYDEQMTVVDALDPTSFERWAFLNATLPPGVGGARVTGRDEQHASVTLRAESSGRRTYPLRRCEVTLNEQREQRALGGRQLGWGRVLAEEEVYGYREANAAGVTSDIALKPTLKARWSATACWFDFTVDLQQSAGQTVGWSLVAALPLRVLASLADVVPCYDHSARRLYIVDAQPGGNGLAAWLYTHAEQVLPLAYDIALACRNDALFESIARVDMDWLLALLGRTSDDRRAATSREQPVAAVPRATESGQRTTEARRRAEFIAGPPPAPPTTSDQRPATNDQRPRTLRLVPPPPPTTDDRPTTNDQRRMTTNAAPPPAAPTTDDRPTTDQRPTTNDAAPMPDAAPTTDDRRPISNPQSPISNAAPPPDDQLPITNYQSPISNAAPPPDDQSPIPNLQSPISNDRSADPTPDPSALLKRLQRQREQRETEQSRRERATKAARPARVAAPVEARFTAGERIFCLPYGEGIVRASSVGTDGRELLTVVFPAHGELQIDTAVSMVRKIETPPDEEDDLL